MSDAVIGAQLERLERAVAAQAREMAEVRQLVETLVEVLIARGDLAAGHARILERATAGARPRRSARLRAYVDKYEVKNSDVDCPSLLHLCHARCCAMAVELTTQDVDEGSVRFELSEPYMLRHERDGYCTHFDRTTLGCGVYHHRPATCREYDCREDRRVWIDFERRIPAPLPPGIAPP
jgi:Fe-S-cluster containining protein